MTRRELFTRLAGAFVGSSLGAWLERHTPPAPVPLAFHRDAFAIVMADLPPRVGDTIRVRLPQRFQTREGDTYTVPNVWQEHPCVITRTPT